MSKLSEESASLYEAADAARGASHAPYSNFRVGAAVLGADGRVATGVNVENVSYPASVCAETVAVGRFVTEGGTRIAAIAVAGDGESSAPCGKCRQVISEFADPDTRVIYRTAGEIIERPFSEILPDAFVLEPRG